MLAIWDAIGIRLCNSDICSQANQLPLNQMNISLPNIMRDWDLFWAFSVWHSLFASNFRFDLWPQKVSISHFIELNLTINQDYKSAWYGTGKHSALIDHMHNSYEADQWSQHPCSNQVSRNCDENWWLTNVTQDHTDVLINSKSAHWSFE